MRKFVFFVLLSVSFSFAETITENKFLEALSCSATRYSDILDKVEQSLMKSNSTSSVKTVAIKMKIISGARRYCDWIVKTADNIAYANRSSKNTDKTIMWVDLADKMTYLMATHMQDIRTSNQGLKDNLFELYADWELFYRPITFEFVKASHLGTNVISGESYRTIDSCYGQQNIMDFIRNNNKKKGTK